MRVHPEEPDPFPFPSRMGGDPGDRSHGDRVVAAEHQREVAAAHDALHPSAGHLGRACDLGEIAGADVAHLELLHVPDVHVAIVHHGMPQLA